MISDKLKNVVRDVNVRMAYSSLNKLQRFVKVHKDALPVSSNKDVVYRITCKDCDATYVGQTSRQLKTRTSEHISHSKKY
ncbi:hypothetical protein X777_12782 [Ooceraea biroi]|uniref:GIY-YIG domain-containing protein n=1 Tax=Ooceraea biroi TaxID=2015173 RepID=A0A026VZ44_OOCBI|nr:hypothetical protein X777_12782 [Ooceraea biroi]